MSDYYFTIAVGNRRTLCISPLTCGEVASDPDRIGDGFGYYLYARDEDEDGLTILADVGSADAARELYSLLVLIAEPAPTSYGAMLHRLGLPETTTAP